MSAILNIGLHVEGELTLTHSDVLRAVCGEGVSILACRVCQSTTEPTLVIEVDRPLNANEGYFIAVTLRQDCIAQWHNGVGELFGPKAQEWGPFNKDFFIFLEAQS